MSLLRQGFGEIARKIRRLGLRRRLRRTARARSEALRTLGRRAYETGATSAASDDVMGRLAAANAQDRELAAQLESLDDSRKKWEAYRDAEAARLSALEQGVLERQAPFEARLAEHRQAADLGRQQVEEVRRRLLQGGQERQSLESALARPAGDPGAADPAQARARIAALDTERQQLEAWQVERAAADASIAAAIEELQRTLAPLHAELERIRAERKSTGDAARKALEELRRQSGGVRKQAEGVSLVREGHFEEIGGALAAAGVAVPALAAELVVWRQADEAHSALQGRYDQSLAESRALPRGTMAKFSGVTAAALLALGGGAWAAVKAVQAMRPSVPVEADEDCREDTTHERPPVVADPGGPYKVVRGGVAPLDGSRSKGRCLTYTWTFGPDPSPEEAPPDKHRPGTGIFAEDEESVAATARVVAENSCPAGTRGNPGARKNGRTAPTTFLCTLEVTLTVTDGRSTDSKSVLVKVQPRGPKGWKTAVGMEKKERYEPGSRLIRTPAGGLPVDLHLGTNVCALDDSPAHAFQAGRSWAGEGYKVASVSDPDGPFDEWSYVGNANLRIQRAARINQDLDQGSALFKRNLKQGYRDIQTLRESVIAHERLHGDLMFEMFRRIDGEGRDPAAALEALSTGPGSNQGLIDVADMAIGQIEGHLLPPQGSDHYAALHEEIKRRLASKFGRAGRILLPDGSGEYGEYEILPSFAQIGENGGG
jgi:hypothetical protein